MGSSRLGLSIFKMAPQPLVYFFASCWIVADLAPGHLLLKCLFKCLVLFLLFSRYYLCYLSVGHWKLSETPGRFRCQDSTRPHADQIHSQWKYILCLQESFKIYGVIETLHAHFELWSRDKDRNRTQLYLDTGSTVMLWLRPNGVVRQVLF